MARSTPAGTPAGESWGKWLNTHLTARGWRQIDLINASGGQLVPQTVSKWVKSLYAPDPNTVVTVAATLGEPLGEALRAAGYEAVADAMEQAAPETPRDPSPDDIQVQRIMADGTRSLERRLEMVRRYRIRSAQIVDYMLQDAGSDEAEAG